MHIECAPDHLAADAAEQHSMCAVPDSLFAESWFETSPPALPCIYLPGEQYFSLFGCSSFSLLFIKLTADTASQVLLLFGDLLGDLLGVSDLGGVE